MKRKNALVWLLSLTAMATGLAACGGENAGSSASVRRILRETPPFVEVSTDLNLDDYISVEYRDESVDYNYTVTCNDPAVTIDGHIVSSDTIGEYRLDVAAGSASIRLSVRFVSSELISITDFLEPLATDPGNYTAASYYGGSNYSYYWTNYRAGTYSVRFDPSDLDKVDVSTDSDTGETYTTPVNNVLAQLSDGNYYSGMVVPGENGGFDVDFEPGIITNAAYYYAMMGISYDSGSFTDTVIGTSSYVMGGSSFAESLVQGGFGYGFRIGAGYDADWYGAAVIGSTDDDDDGELDTVTFEILYTYQGQVDTVMIISLSDVGTTSLDWVNTAQTDATYVPVPYTAPEIPAAFKALSEGGNYTLSATLSQLDEDGSKIVDVTSTDDYLYAAYKCNSVTMTNTYTEDGVISVTTGYQATADDSGNVTEIAEEAKQLGGWAAWNDGTKSWKNSFDDDTGAYGPRTEIVDSAEASTTDVYGEFIDKNGLSAAAITAGAASSTNWTGRTEDGSIVSYEGDCGDNTEEGATNLLFQQLFDMFGTGLGTYWCEQSNFTDQDGNATVHALTLSSSYTSFEINTETNEIKVSIFMYGPFSDIENGYFDIELTISDIGTTENDFSVFPTEEAEPTDPSSSSSSVPAA